MTMPEYAPQIHPISRKEVRSVAVDCQGNLEDDDVITGAPTATEVGTDHLDITDVQISTEALSINGANVPIGKAILFKVDARDPSVRHRWTYGISLVFDTAGGERVEGGVRVRTD